jgi:hypothetical protein
MKHALATILASGVALAGERGAPELVHRTYELSAGWPEVHFAEVTEPLAPALLEPGAVDDATALDAADTRSVALELLDGLFRPELDYEGSSIQKDDEGRIHVVAPAAIQDEFVALLTFLEATLRRPIELRLDFVERAADANALPAVMSIDDAAKVVAAAGRGTRSATLRLEPGRVATFDASREVATVANCRVEIASRIFQARPVASAYTLGTRALARAAAVPGGVRVALVLRDAQAARAPGTHAVEITGKIATQTEIVPWNETVEIDQPFVLGRAFALNLFVPDGQALAVDTSLSVAAGSSRLAILVQARRPQPDAVASWTSAASRRRLDVIDASAFSPPLVAIESEALARGSFARRLGGLVDSRFENDVGAWVSASLRAGDASRAVEALHAAGAAQVASLGPWLFVRPPPAGESAAAVERAIAAGAERAHSAVPVAIALRRAGVPEPVASCELALAAGETSSLVLGGETTLIDGFATQVAEGASALEPSVSRVFDGLALSLRAAWTRDGGSWLEIVARAHALARMPAPYGHEGPVAARLQRAEHANFALDERLSFPAQGGARRVTLGGAGDLTLDVEVR